MRRREHHPAKASAGRCRLTTSGARDAGAPIYRAGFSNFSACQPKTLMLWYFSRLECRGACPPDLHCICIGFASVVGCPSIGGY